MSEGGLCVVFGTGQVGLIAGEIGHPVGTATTPLATPDTSPTQLARP